MWVVGNWTISKWGSTQCAYYSKYFINAAQVVCHTQSTSIITSSYIQGSTVALPACNSSNFIINGSPSLYEQLIYIEYLKNGSFVQATFDYSVD